MNKLTYISLFSSAGVGCYGFKQVGFKCVATNELIDRRIEVQKCNSKCKYESGYIQGDILQQEVKNQIKNQINMWKEKENISEITVIVATPPCQGMSVANHKKKDEQCRNSLVVESIKIIMEVMPKFFVLENVRAFLKTICTDIDGVDKRIEDAIDINLGKHYNISKKILNFKNYGANSSRTRTLIIGAKKELKIDPEQLFPHFNEEKTLHDVIGLYSPLEKMGEVSSSDIYHSFKKYNPIIRKWIENLKEGEDSFGNTEEDRIPHYFRNGAKIITKKGNGDKYRRQYWNKVAPCIHTRNDILASQNTIHPVDDRVFSIREVMDLMTVPKEFNWTKNDLSELNNLSDADKCAFLKKNEINIRQSLGEAVPTEVFKRIAKNIKKMVGDARD